MTNRMMDIRIKKLHAIEAQQKELEAQAEAIRSELKAELDANGEDEHNTGSFIIRWKEILQSLSLTIKNRRKTILQGYIIDIAVRRTRHD